MMTTATRDKRLRAAQQKLDRIDRKMRAAREQLGAGEVERRSIARELAWLRDAPVSDRPDDAQPEQPEVEVPVLDADTPSGLGDPVMAQLAPERVELDTDTELGERPEVAQLAPEVSAWHGA